MMNSSEIIQKAKEFGADLVKCVSMDRLKDLSPDQDPRRLLPKAKSVIVLGHRILRGSMRGIEEGTNFYSTYVCFGLAWPKDRFLAQTVFNLSVFLEDNGAIALPVSENYAVDYRDPEATRSTGNTTVLPQKEVADLQAVAVAAGLGVIGKGGFFLTEKYGHRQRLALILTDAEFHGPEAETPPMDICKDCHACIDACPMGAITKNKDHSGYRIDFALCQVCPNGANGSWGELDRCAASCGRACLDALEKRIANRFVQPFRKRGVWSIDRNGEHHFKERL